MHFSCLVQDIHQAAPPWCSTASVSLSKPSPSLDSPPTSKVDSCTVSYPKPYHSPVHPRGSESSPISPRFERNSTFSLPFIPRRPISGRRVDLLLALPLLSLSPNLLFSITRFPRHGSRHRIPLLFVWTLLTRSSIARFYRDTRFCRVRGMINWIETRKFCSR